MKKIIIIIIKIYKYTIDPLLASNCRFYPTCSNYAIDALKKYKIHKSIFYIIKRIIKCNPFFYGGYDPI